MHKALRAIWAHPLWTQYEHSVHNTEDSSTSVWGIDPMWQSTAQIVDDSSFPLGPATTLGPSRTPSLTPRTEDFAQDNTDVGLAARESELQGTDITLELGPEFSSRSLPQPINTTSDPRRGHRIRKTPAHFDQYLCYNTCTNNPVSTTTPLQQESSGTQYPIYNYVTCTNFSRSHQQFLVVITKIAKPRFLS